LEAILAKERQLNAIFTTRARCPLNFPRVCTFSQPAPIFPITPQQFITCICICLPAIAAVDFYLHRAFSHPSTGGTLNHKERRERNNVQHNRHTGKSAAFYYRTLKQFLLSSNGIKTALSE
jgi:hypothetical protein